MYDEEEFLQLSGIQHFAFCRRQWALAYIELQWQENVRTVEGRLLHENAHDAGIKEKRGDLIIVRAMPVHSRELGSAASVMWWSSIDRRKESHFPGMRENMRQFR